MDMQSRPPQTQWKSLRTTRTLISNGLPFVGVLIVLSSVLLVQEVGMQLIVVMIGLLIMEASVWRIASWLLPSERQYHALRHETERFVTLARELNSAAVAAKKSDSEVNRQRCDEMRQAMHQAVDHMAEVAGMTDDEASRKMLHIG